MRTLVSKISRLVSASNRGARIAAQVVILIAEDDTSAPPFSAKLFRRGDQNRRLTDHRLSPTMTFQEPKFGESFRQQFEELLKWRRDVRSFRSDPVDARLLEHLIRLASLAPSVGYSQPWRFVVVESEEYRESIRANFERRNREALNLYSGEKAQLYASLKLAGLRDAPIHLAIFLISNTAHGSGLGRVTMPESLEYSAILAVHTLWLAARWMGAWVGYPFSIQWKSIAA